MVGQHHRNRKLTHSTIVGALAVAGLLIAGTSTSLAASRPQVERPQLAGPIINTTKGTVCLMWPNETTPAWTAYQIPTAVAAFKKYLPNMKQLQSNGNNDA